MIKKSMMLVTFIIFILLLVSCLGTNSATEEKEFEQPLVPTVPQGLSTISVPPLVEGAEIIVTEISADTGGKAVYYDGTNISFQEEGLTISGEIAIKKVSADEILTIKEEFSILVGDIYEISFGASELLKPATLEIPFDINLISEKNLAEDYFVASYNEDLSIWESVGGIIDIEKGTISAEINHASKWSIREWNREGIRAWITSTFAFLKGDYVDSFQVSPPGSLACDNSSSTYSIDNSNSKGILRACIQIDDPINPTFKVTNIGSFFIELYFEPTKSGDNGSKILGTADSYVYQVDTTKIEPPSIVRTEISQRALTHLLIDLFLNIFPGVYGELAKGEKGEIISCIAKNSGTFSEIGNASQALYNEDVNGFNESFTKLLLDRNFVDLFIREANLCSEGVLEIVGSSIIERFVNWFAYAGTIATVGDVLIGVMVNEGTSEVVFHWTSAIKNLEVLDDGKVFLGELLILDVANYSPNCSYVDKVSYAPNDEHFLITLSCHEGDNHAFLFDIDGSNKTQITEEWDYLNYDFFDWSPDGRYLVYQRINTCCLSEVPDTAPPAGLVRYDVMSGSEFIIGEGVGGIPLWSPDGRWIAFWGRPWQALYLADANNGELWLLDLPSSASQLSWEIDETQRILYLRYYEDGQEKKVEIGMEPDDTPSGTPSPLESFEMYSVIGISPDDPLNIRSEPGVLTDDTIVGEIPFFGVDILKIGEGVFIGQSLWIPIRYRGIEGWVHSDFLAEQPFP